MLTVKKSQQNFIKLLALFTAIAIPWVIGGVYIYNTSTGGRHVPVKLVNFAIDTVPKVNHSKFKILQQNFETPQQVTEACISCHNKTDHDIMATSHWKWGRQYITDSGDTIELGKKNIINNFCIGIQSNEPRCTSCHAGYGWKDKEFDFTASKNIDCIVCHDQTGTYKKFPTGAGNPVTKEKVFMGKTFYPPDYKKIAQKVGTPKRENCGTCHYTGGGGNNVKHGDLEKALNKTSRKVDVHMGINSTNMSCVECHKTDRHNISGSLYSIASENKNRVSCENCHTEAPHKNPIINNHTERIACQTCHIPEYAKVNPTKMYWDWSSAGKFNEDGSMIVKKDSMGNTTYMTKKGSFVWDKNVKPDYVWFNGKARHYIVGEKIDPSKTVKLNSLQGSYSDKNSKIIPVKTFTGKQIYDAKNNYMIVPHLFGKDSTSYWKNFNWDKAARVGMEHAGVPYSGEFSFISTEMQWPINHMVAPREKSLTCTECHTRNGRLAKITDFYLPGRDYNNWLDKFGIIMILLSFVGVIVHATLRIIKK